MSDKTEAFQAEHVIVGPEKTYSIRKQTIIGRSKGDLILNDKKLSSTHCQLTLEGIQLLVTDLESTNGVYINGKRIPSNSPITLKNGDELKLGTYSYFYFDSPSSIQENKITNAPVRGWLAEFRSYTDIRKPPRTFLLSYIGFFGASIGMNLASITFSVPSEFAILEEYYSNFYSMILAVVLTLASIALHGYLTTQGKLKSLKQVRAMFFAVFYLGVYSNGELINQKAQRIKDFIEEYKIVKMDKEEKSSGIIYSSSYLQYKYCKLLPFIKEEDREKFTQINQEFFDSLKSINEKVVFGKKCPKG